MELLVFIGIVWFIACGAFTHGVANSKGFGNLFWWAVAGLLFGPLALIAAGFWRPSLADRRRQVERETRKFKGEDAD